MDRRMTLKIPCHQGWLQPPWNAHSRVHNPAGSLQYVSQSLPITLLVFCEVLGEHRTGPVFLRHTKCGFTECVVLLQAAFGRRGFPEDSRTILSYLDEFCCNEGIQPDQISEHLLNFLVLHTDTS